MARMSEIEWEPCLLTQRPAPELEMRFERETGRPGKLMRYFEGSKWLGDTMLLMSVQLTTFVHIDTNLADQVGLVVSQDNSCRFCFGVQRAFLRVLGMSEKHIARLEQDLLTGDRCCCTSSHLDDKPVSHRARGRFRCACSSEAFATPIKSLIGTREID